MLLGSQCMISELINQGGFECHLDAYIFIIDESSFTCKYYMKESHQETFTLLGCYAT
jgi:hypothetical protein